MKADDITPKLLCRPSMCPPDTSTHLDTSDKPRKITIELELGRHSLSVVPGQTVDAGQVIGYINGVAAESPARFIVTETGDNWIVGEYITDTDMSAYDENYIGSIINGGSDFDAIKDIASEYASVNMFIKDYVLRCQFPRIASFTKDHTAGSAKAVSTQKFIRTYEKRADNIIDDLNERIQDICDADNIKTHAENGTSQQLKDQIDTERDSAFEKIISQYRNVSVDNLCATGSVGDFMLYEYYTDYLTGDDFVYDDSNPYVIRLFNYISERIAIRSKLEANNASISDEIVRFNELVSDVLGVIWDPKKDNDYYAEIRSKFTYDFYANDTDDIEAQITDNGRVSLYSKVLGYLKSLVSYRSPDSKTMTVTTTTKKDDGTDVETSVDIEQDPDTDEVLAQLKKISILFCRLRKFEVSASAKEYSAYISDDDLNNIFTLKKNSGEKYVTNYTTGNLNNVGTSEKTYSGTKASSSDSDRLLKKYLGALKSVTDEESREISRICDDAISWYEMNHAAIDNYSIFDSLRRISWPSPSVIHKDECDCDFYLLKESVDGPHAAPEGYEFSETSLITQYDIGSYMYWLRYLGIASAINCTIPAYWSTGLVISGAPVSLPIILLPIFVIPGRVLAVICIGICGLAIYPTILFANLGSIFGCIIPIVNSVVDVVKGLAQQGMDAQFKLIPALSAPTVEGFDKMIDECDAEIRQCDIDILTLRSEINVDKETMKALKKRIGKVGTMKAKEKGDE